MQGRPRSSGHRLLPGRVGGEAAQWFASPPCSVWQIDEPVSVLQPARARRGGAACPPGAAWTLSPGRVPGRGRCSRCAGTSLRGPACSVSTSSPAVPLRALAGSSSGGRKSKRALDSRFRLGARSSCLPVSPFAPDPATPCSCAPWPQEPGHGLRHTKQPLRQPSERASIDPDFGPEIKPLVKRKKCQEPLVHNAFRLFAGTPDGRI